MNNVCIPNFFRWIFRRRNLVKWDLRTFIFYNTGSKNVTYDVTPFLKIFFLHALQASVFKEPSLYALRAFKKHVCAIDTIIEPAMTKTRLKTTRKFTYVSPIFGRTGPSHNGWLRKAKIRKLGRQPYYISGCEQREGRLSEWVPEGCAAVIRSATIGRYRRSAMLNFSGLASLHNSIADLKQGQWLR